MNHLPDFFEAAKIQQSKGFADKEKYFFKNTPKSQIYSVLLHTEFLNGMTSFLSIYNDIEDKLRKTSSQLIELQGKIQKLQQENEALKRQAAVMEKMRTEWPETEENINTQSYTNHTKDNDTIYKIKEEISEIVREIDNCIGILNAE